MNGGEAAAQLREEGVAVLRSCVAVDSLFLLREAAIRCFEAVEAGGPDADRLGFNCFSHSIPLTSLIEFGCGREELLQLLSDPVVQGSISLAMGCDWASELEQSWLRKKFAPLEAPATHYRIQDWHQDGALGVQFPADPPTSAIPMTQLLTVWIPLDACGRERPGLEFVRGHQPALVHFSELNDANVRSRFPARDFWAPELEFGDGLIFLNSVLHRTYVRPKMQRNRLSLEYRIFPA